MQDFSVSDVTGYFPGIISLSPLSPEQQWGLCLYLTLDVPKVTEVKYSPSYSTNGYIKLRSRFHFWNSIFFIYMMLSVYFNAFEQESKKLQVKIHFFLSLR